MTTGSNPINNRCVKLKGEYDCLKCPAAYRRGDMIIWCVDELKRMLVSARSVLQLALSRFTYQPGYRQLVDFVRENPAPNKTILWDGTPASSLPGLAVLQPLDMLLNDPIKVLDHDGDMSIQGGRHRICGAYQFGVTHLPIYVNASHSPATNLDAPPDN